MPYTDMVYLTAAVLLIPAALWSAAVWWVSVKLG
jgi:hypothetical protein